MLPSFEFDYICQAVDSKGVVTNQASSKNEAELIGWFKLHAQKGHFVGKKCVIKKRLLKNGKPVMFHVEAKHYLWLVVVAQAAFIAYVFWRLA